ncbi:transposase IS3/IS911 [Comamonas thiooxydans]|nr:transposase IS3/IS911 [Comamonas thiooxydans]
MPGSYVLRTKAAFSAADQRRLRWSRVMTSIVSVCLVIRTVLCLSRR